MVKKNSIKLFGSDKIRAVWDDEQEKWYFSVVDVVAVLTESGSYNIVVFLTICISYANNCFTL